MSFLARSTSFARALLRRGRVEDEMNLEMEAHIEERTADLIRSGLPSAAARQQAHREFGDPTRWREQGFEARGLLLVDQLRADARAGIRGLLRSPTFATAAILSIAIGVGANVAIFSVVNAVLLRLAPVRDPASLVLLGRSNDSSGLGSSFSFPFFSDLRNSPLPGLSGVMARAGVSANVAVDGGEPERVTVELVSASFFDVLGVRPAIGRAFIPADDVLGAEPVAILSDGYWRRRFGGSPDAVGQTISVNGASLRVVGVAPRTFDGVDLASRPDVRVPLALQPVVTGMASRLENSNEFWLLVEGRLAPGASRTAVAAELTARFRSLVPPVTRSPGQPEISVHLLDGSRGRPTIQRRLAQPLAALSGLGAAALLLVCLNVANLLIGRTVARQQELAIRAAIGAGRGRLLAQLFVETEVMVLAGAAVGLLFARWAAGTLADMAAPATSGVPVQVVFEGRVYIFLAAITLVVGLVCGAWPAWNATAGVSDVTRFERRQVAGGRIAGRRWLVAAQVSLALTLLVGAGLFARTFANLHNIDIGADPDRVLMARIDPTPSAMTVDRLAVFHDELLSRIRALPGTTAAAEAAIPIISGSDWGSGVVLDTGAVDSRPERNAVTPDYFRTLGTTVVQGREFQPTDDASGGKVAIVNETFARLFFDGQAIGRRIGPAETTGRAEATIVGVVRDGKYAGLREESVPLWFVPLAQIEELGHTDTAERIRAGIATLYVRTSGDPAIVVPAIARTVAEVDPRVLVMGTRTIADQINDQLAVERLIARLAIGFAAIAMFLAAVGLYAVTAYDVSMRTREFGVRAALGATAGTLLAMVLRQTMAIIVIGTTVGVLLSLATANAARALLYGLEPTDPLVLAVAVALVGAVTLAAALIPARRASRVNPAIALQ